LNYQLVTDISVWSVALPVAAGVGLVNRERWSVKLLVLFFAFSLLIELLAWRLGNQLGRSNIWVYNLYLILETPVWLVVLGGWSTTLKLKKFLLCLAALFLMVWLTWIFVGGWNVLSSEIGVARGLVLCVVAGMVLLRESQRVAIDLFRNLKFWIASGVVLYFCLNTVLFSLWTIILNSTESQIARMWVIHSVVNIFANVLYTIGLLCSYRNTTSLSPSSP